ncbi:hypothetical protein J2789_004892 [Variovorax paradoxus]|uniref:hypothetical protein n=1 Tax=Variovorax atrisoli TaxID=3394203 RepID=UPI0011994FDF|nr:hypothetical protein [Variovorax paradoxus]MDR6522202.1 hypothetical protein [Variovorax paradoxus]
MRDENLLLARRQAEFEDFYKGLLAALVDFVDRLGIRPAHEVLNHAQQFAPHLETALCDLAPADEDDRTWLLTRVAYFVGEFFVQKHKGCWYVCDVNGAKYFARYVVGRFPRVPNGGIMVDPFEVAQVFVDSARPRRLSDFLEEVETALMSKPPLH